MIRAWVLAFLTVACTDRVGETAPREVVADAAAVEEADAGLTIDARACGAGSVEACTRLAQQARAIDAAQARSLYGIVCSDRGLVDQRREPCIDFQLRMAGPPSCGNRGTFWLNHVEMCTTGSTIEVPIVGRMQSVVFASDAKLERAVTRVFVEHQRPFRECYSVARFRDRTLAGTVTFGLVVDRIGGFSNISARSRTIDDPGTIDCLVRATAVYRADIELSEPVQIGAELTFLP